MTLNTQFRWLVNHNDLFKGTMAEMLEYVRAHYTYDDFCCAYDVEEGDDNAMGPDDVWGSEELH